MNFSLLLLTEDFNEPSVHQEFTQAQDSGLEIRIKEKDAIRDLER